VFRQASYAEGRSSRSAATAADTAHLRPPADPVERTDAQVDMTMLFHACDPSITAGKQVVTL
jgi:hypothetical protein